MILPFCIFTYSGGALLIPHAVRIARAAGLIPVICDDAASPLPPNVRGWLEYERVDYLQTTFQRRGNLNGTDCAAGICHTLAAVARRYGASHAIKGDDDTAIRDRRVFTRHRRARAVGLTWKGERAGAYGMAMMLRADVAEAVADRLERLPVNPRAPEDITTWTMAKRLGPVVERRFRVNRGPFSCLPPGAEIDDRFGVLNVGMPPAGGWIDRAAQTAGEMARIASHTSPQTPGFQPTLRP